MIAAALFAIAPMGVSMVNSSTIVHADKVVPGRGKKYTFPKSWRGTWYANNSKARHKKVVFGVHPWHWNYTPKWDLFQPRTMKIKGKKVMYLKTPGNKAENTKYFKSKRLAKKY